MVTVLNIACPLTRPTFELARSGGKDRGQAS
jgi:hypothetical protein